MRSLPEENLALGWDFSTQQIKVVAVGIKTGEVVFEDHIKFDDDLPHFKTKGGVHVHSDGVTVTSPPAMWLQGLDLMLQKLLSSELSLDRVMFIGGAAQQHGSVYWRAGARQRLQSLEPGRSLHQQLADCFSVQQSPIWMDASTELQCRCIEAAANGAQSLSDQTGARAYHRYTAAQIKKLYDTEPAAYESTERVSLVSSFAASLFLGDYAPLAEGDASGMNLMHIRHRKWLPQVADSVAPGLLHKLGHIVHDRTLIGRVSGYLAARCGLNAQCQVCAFTGDNPATLAGLRLAPGDLAVSLGSSTCAFFHLPQLPPSVPLGTVVMAASVARDAFMPMVVLKNGSLSREQLLNELCGGSWSTFDSQLLATPAGNGGRLGLFLEVPEIAPERAVGRFRVDPSGRPVGSFESDAQELRAAVEGHFLSLRHFAEQLVLQRHSGRLVATGGASANAQLLQLLADAFNRPLLVSPVANSAALGAALLAVSAARPDADFLDAVPPPPSSSSATPVAVPRPEAVAEYQRIGHAFGQFLMRLQQQFAN